VYHQVSSSKAVLPKRHVSGVMKSKKRKLDDVLGSFY
jgi:hypothetical protein